MPLARLVALALLLVAPSAGAVTYTVDVSLDPSENTDGDATYESLVDALIAAECGDTVVVYPGVYDFNISFRTLNKSLNRVGNKLCTAEAPLVVRARYPVVSTWDDDEWGPGILRACTKDGADITCDSKHVSYVASWSTANTETGGGNNSHLHLIGFETHYIGFGALDDTQFGCKGCRIERNFFNVYFNRCLQLVRSHGVEVVGNHIYRCGGDDSGDQTLSFVHSLGGHMHHNEIYGSGLPNGPGIENDTIGCTSANWRTTCKDDFHGTDGYTVASTVECGTRVHHNRFHDLQQRWPGSDDGDAMDFKKAVCTDDPIHVYKNEVFGQGGTGQIVFHVGARGIRIYDNVIRDGALHGVYFQGGQECAGGNDYGWTGDVVVASNLISGHAGSGIRTYHTTTPSCVGSDGLPEKRSFFDLVFRDNVVTDNGGGLLNANGILVYYVGIQVGYISDDGTALGAPLGPESVRVVGNYVADNATSAAGAGEDFDLTVASVAMPYTVVRDNIVLGRAEVDGVAYDDVSALGQGNESDSDLDVVLQGPTHHRQALGLE